MHKKTEHIENTSRASRVVAMRVVGLILVFVAVGSIFFLTNYFKSRPDPEKPAEEIQPVYNKSLFMPGVKLGILNKERVTEASGMVASRKNPGVFWVHNDAGNSATIYAIKADGEFISAYRVKQAKSRDWEDVAIGPGPEKGVDYIYIGNIGDNNLEYASVAIYRVEEPKVDINQATGSADKLEDVRIGPAAEIELLYPDGPKDAETLLVDPLNGDIYIITKGKSSGLVYMAPYPQAVDSRTTLEFIAEVPMAKATGGDVSPDGSCVIVRASKAAGLWIRPAEQKLWMAFIDQPVWIDLAKEPQGEAVCFDANSNGFYTLSEMKHPYIYYFARIPSE